MPKYDTDYSKTIIYVIRCNDHTISDEYIGSTTNFTKRKNCHKTRCCNEKQEKHHFKLYQIMKENGGWDNWSMIQLEEYPCENKRQAETREEYWRTERQAQLNMRKAFLTDEERVENRKEYRINNKEKIKENKTRAFNCDCGAVVQTTQKARHFQTKKHIKYLIQCQEITF